MLTVVWWLKVKLLWVVVVVVVVMEEEVLGVELVWLIADVREKKKRRGMQDGRVYISIIAGVGWLLRYWGRAGQDSLTGRTCIAFASALHSPSTSPQDREALHFPARLRLVFRSLHRHGQCPNRAGPISDGTCSSI
jgi:hypothetical protein